MFASARVQALMYSCCCQKFSLRGVGRTPKDSNASFVLAKKGLVFPSCEMKQLPYLQFLCT